MKRDRSKEPPDQLGPSFMQGTGRSAYCPGGQVARGHQSQTNATEFTRSPDISRTCSMLALAEGECGASVASWLHILSRTARRANRTPDLSRWGAWRKYLLPD